MNSTLIRFPDLVVLDVQPLTDLLYPAYEAANMAARQFFEDRQESIEPYHYASTVRYVAKRYILSHGVAVEVEYDMDDVANNGLKIQYERYAVRCRKIDRRERDGAIVLAPSPGDSAVMQQFYAQQIQLDLPGFAFANPELNLLVLWDYSAGFLELFLSCPAGGHSRRSVAEHWWRPLPHPAVAAPAVPAAPPAPEPQIGYSQLADESSDESDSGADHG